MQYGKKFRKLGFILVFTGVFIMSFESSIIKFASVDGWEFLFWLGLSLFISALIMIYFSKNKKFSFKNKIPLLFASACMAFSNICFVFAVKFTGIATTVLTLAITPIVCALLDLLITKKKTPKTLFFVSVLVAIGLIIILKDSQKEINMIGVALALSTVVLFSLLYITLSNYPKIDRKIQIACCGLIITVVSFFFADISFNLSQLYPVFFMGFFIMPISRFLMTQGSKYVLSAEMGLLTILESILAPIWGMLFLNEILSANTIIGGSIIIISIIFYIIRTKV